MKYSASQYLVLVFLVIFVVSFVGVFVSAGLGSEDLCNKVFGPTAFVSLALTAVTGLLANAVGNRRIYVADEQDRIIRWITHRDNPKLYWIVWSLMLLVALALGAFVTYLLLYAT